MRCNININNVFKKMVLACLTFILSFGAAAFGEVAMERLSPQQGAKEVSGKVSGVAGYCISVVYSKSADGKIEQEILIPIDKDTKFDSFDSIGQLQVGDTVSVEYSELPEEKDGKQEINTRATKIRFIRPAPVAQEQEPEVISSDAEDSLISIEGERGESSQ